MAAWHKKHISTPVGVGMLTVLLITLGIAVFQVNQIQDVRSRAASDSSMGSAPPGSSSFGGAPSSESMGSAPGEKQSAPKANSASKKWTCSMLDNKTIQDKKTDARCQNIKKTSCAGGLITDPYCPGDNNIQCCVVSPACKAKGGKCIVYKKSLTKEGTFIKGFCPGPDNIQCYIPKK
jgi:hypothetical protein